nr:phage tail tape measure protein [uncultured Mediterranean phage uvMED]
MADYGINVVANVQAQQLKSLLTQLQQLRNAVKDINKTKITGDVQEQKQSTAAVTERNKAIRENKKAQMEANRSLLDSSNALMGSANKIRNTSAAVRASQKEVKKYSRDWNDLQRLITKLDFSSAFKDLQHLDKLARQTAAAFELMQKGGQGFPNFAGKLTLNELLKFEPTNTTKALQTYQDVLQDVLVDVDRGSEIYREFAARIEEVNRRLGDTSSRKGVPTTMYSSPIGPQQRPGFFDRALKSNRFRDIATGAGFPLLFGGGPLQALAGGIGGGAGGLGGAIAASAIASQVQAFAVSAAKAGQALQSTGGALEFVREKSLFSSAETKNLAAELEEQGKVQELATLLTNELTDVIGTSGLIALQDLGATTDETTKLWNQLTTQLQILISGPLNGFLELVNKILGGINEGLKPTAVEDFRAVRNRILESGTAEQIAQIEAIEAQVRGTVSTNVRGAAFGGGTETQAGALTETGALTGLELAGKAGLMPKIAITPEDLRTIKPPGASTSKGRTKTDRVPQLEIEVALTERLNALNRQILEASSKEDLVRRAALEKEVELEKKAAAIAKIRAGDAPLAEQALQIKKINLETDQAIFKINHDLKELKQQQIDKGADIVEDLQFQLAIAQATNEVEKERLKVKQAMEGLKGDNLLEGDLVKIEKLLNKIAEENSPLNQFKKQLETLIDPINQTIAAANAIGDAFSESFRGVVSGSMTAQEALANLFQRTADHFLDMTAEIIAAAIKAQAVKFVAQIIGSVASAGVSSGSSFAGVENTTLDSVLPSTASLADAAAATPLNLYAEGGYVNKPTNALIGEGGEPEYVIPESKMRESMSRYLRGSRGNSVIPTNGGGSGMEDSGGGAVAAPIDVRYTVERINSVDYVTADQFQSGMQSAAAQGAQRGEQNTLKRLQMSGSTRRRLGM